MRIKACLAAASLSLSVFAAASGAQALDVTTNVANPEAVLGDFGGVFNVTAYNVTNLNSSESQATVANYNAAAAGTLGDGGTNAASVIQSDTFTYSGLLRFGTSAGTSTTISDFVGTGPGTVTGLDGAFGGLQNSKGSIGNGSATSTFYLFETEGSFSPGAFDIAHDDGVRVVNGGLDISGFLSGDSAGNNGPTSLRRTQVTGFDGGALSFLYVSTNSDPSILRVNSTVSAVPLPAGILLLTTALAGFGFMRRLQVKAA